MCMSDALLSLKDIHLDFFYPEQKLAALRGVSLEIKAGEIVALVGESGSGKTLTALSILNLLEPPGKITAGQILFAGENILHYSESHMQKFRGKEVAMIFQEPMTALNPVFTIGFQISEVLITHLNLSKKVALQRAIELLESVGIPEASKRINSYPFQLSGGMLQRVMIAIVLAASPRLLIADEPTTALDVTIQAQILSLIKKLSLEKKMAVLFITHDLALVAQLANRVAIMYAGKIVEIGDTASVLTKTKHPYTKALLASLPQANYKKRLTPIKGMSPSLAEIAEGCAFAPRCSLVKDQCLQPIQEKLKNKQRWLCIQ